MYILGISCYYHDSAACLLKDGQLAAAAQEERFTRIKHDLSFPVKAIKFCFEHEGIKEKDIDLVVFHEKPFVKFERIIKTIVSTYPGSYGLFREVAINWLKDKLWIKATICEALNIEGQKVLFSGHHFSHAAGSFFSSPFKEAALLTVDGVGEWGTTTFGTARADWDGKGRNEIRIFKQIDFPHSIGLLYSAFTAFLGFKVNNGEYKVMGMSAFGEPKYTDKVYKLIKTSPDASFRLNMEYFTYHYSTSKSYSDKFVKLFGKPRRPESRFAPDKGLAFDGPPVTDDEVEESKFYADIAASIQKVTEDILIKMANRLYHETKLKKLCMAGGVALNCVANYRILNETPFEEIYVQPAAGDNGCALGAALYVWHCFLGKPRKFVLDHAYWGKSYANDDIKGFLRGNNIKYKEFDAESGLLDYVIEAIADQKIVGWFQGRSEWGPRALGNRSILADPRNPKMKDTINVKIKFRELFRPFAPSVLYEHLGMIFDINGINRDYPFRFMLYTLPVKHGLIPAATHVDGTSRIQVVYKDTNPLYHRLIERFNEKTHVPALVNTSFNLKGEPIVDSPQDAYSTFERSGIDCLVLGNFVIEK